MCHGVDVEVREQLLNVVSSLSCRPGKELRSSGLAATVPLPIEPSGQPQFYVLKSQMYLLIITLKIL